MRNVTRTGKPNVLAKNATRWKKALLDEIGRCGKTGDALKASISDKYRHDDILRALKEMYGGRCCYCEAQIGIVSYEHIEHRRPKDRTLFPEYTFDWDNLHLACQKCNMAKGKKWDSAAPILDAVVDVPITDHLAYEESGLGLRRLALTDQGNTTVEHADLDRGGFDGLPGARAKILLEAMKTIGTIKSCLKQSEQKVKIANLKRELSLKAEDDFGTVVTWAIEKWLDHDAN